MNNSILQTLATLKQETPKITKYIALSDAIENGTMPEQYDIFLSFFELGEHFSSLLDDNKKWLLYSAQFELMMSSISNISLPNPWRRTCYETLTKPLMSLQRIAKTDERKRLLCSYYLTLNKDVSALFKSNPF